MAHSAHGLFLRIDTESQNQYCNTEVYFITATHRPPSLSTLNQQMETFQTEVSRHVTTKSSKTKDFNLGSQHQVDVLTHGAAAWVRAEGSPRCRPNSARREAAMRRRRRSRKRAGVNTKMLPLSLPGCSLGCSGSSGTGLWTEAQINVT